MLPTLFLTMTWKQQILITEKVDDIETLYSFQNQLEIVIVSVTWLNPLNEHLFNMRT